MDKNSESIYKRAVDTLFNDTNSSLTPTPTNFSSTPTNQDHSENIMFYLVIGVVTGLAIIVTVVSICVIHKRLISCPASDPSESELLESDDDQRTNYRTL